jgi:protein O-mannosyl-transferase
VILIAVVSLADWDFLMPKKSRAKAAAASRQVPRCTLSLPEPNARLVRWGILSAGIIIVLAAFTAYHNSFSGPFIFDDESATTDNPTIRHFRSALLPPSDATTGGRPLLNLTFALNYAMGGMNVWGYHAVNLLIHALAGLVLFGIVRRTLSRPPLAGRFGAEAVPLALAVAVIWIVHPLQTEAVTYISQRAESLMGLFYLLTLYIFIRSAESLAPARWQILSVLACLLGVMSKEIIVTAPLMVLLYDRTFVAGSFREAWRLRWRYYLGLACTWLLLARLMTGLGQRKVGFGQGIAWWSYALTSCRSVVLYLKLAFWPHPLVFDYGINVIRHATEAAPYALGLAILMVGTTIALLRWPAIGFASAWFFVILVPASSIIPVVKQPMAEHRLYLSLAGVIALGVLGLYRLIGRPGLMVCAAVAAGLGGLSVRRNHDYRSELAIWNDTMAKRPDNERAYYSLGSIFLQTPGHLFEAIAELQAALRINPDYVEAHSELGYAYLQVPGRLSEAIAEFQSALRLNPDYADAHNNFGDALLQIPGRLPDAIAEYQAALRINPDYTVAHINLGYALSQMPGRLPDVIAEYQAALRIDPDCAEAHYNLGCVFAQIPGRLPEAITHFKAALRIRPDFKQAQQALDRLRVKQ